MIRSILILSAVGLLAVGCASESNAEPDDSSPTSPPSSAQTTTPRSEPATATPAPNATPALTTDSTPTSAAATTQPLPEQLRAVQTATFTIGVPQAWSVLFLDEGTTSTEEPDASISPAVEGLALAAGMQAAELLAVADDAASANLMVTALGPDEEPPSAETSEAMRARLAESGVTDLHLELIDLPAGLAVLSSYRRVLENGAERQISSVYLPSPATTSWTVTLDTPAGAAEADLISEIADSFTPS